MKEKKVLLVIFAALLLGALGCRPGAREEAVQPTEPSTIQRVSSELPAAVVEVINKYFPGAEIDFVETENVDGLPLYDIEFKNNRGEIEVAADGTIIDITSIIGWDELPQAAADAIKKALEEAAASLERLEKAEVQAEIKEQDGKKAIVKLPHSYWLFEAEFSREGQRGEMQVDPQGKIIEGPKWESKVK